MYRIVRKEIYSPVTFMWELEAPDMANACLPGHFVMIRQDASSERIPLTVADFDRQKGTVTLVVQALGKSTKRMMELEAGDSILDFVGPLGEPSEMEDFGTVVCVGGGLGIAPVFPQLRAFKEAGNRTISVVGFRSKELMFWVDKFERYSDELLITTDDGSFGEKALVTAPLKRVLEQGGVDRVVAIGPLVMMKACAETTRPFGVKTIVSLNSIMVDGTGMCGSCRVTVGGEMKFACVDGPEFDAHQVDFDELMARQRRFDMHEKAASAAYDHACKIGLGRK